MTYTEYVYSKQSLIFLSWSSEELASWPNSAKETVENEVVTLNEIIYDFLKLIYYP